MVQMLHKKRLDIHYLGTHIMHVVGEYVVYGADHSHLEDVGEGVYRVLAEFHTISIVLL